MKAVIVTVKSTQRDKDGQDSVVELVTEGRYYEKAKAKYILYEETEMTGLAGVQTTIKIWPDSVVVLRSQGVHMRHQYALGREEESVYKTPYGDFDMIVKTHELSIDVQAGEGSIHVGYDISLEGEWVFYNQLDITVREDKS